MAFPGRTDATEMAKICTLTAGLDTSLAIDLANEIVTDVLSVLTQDDEVTPYYTDHYLTLLETLAACHFYCLNDPRGQRERVGPLTFEAQSKVDLGWNVTHYGQMLLRMDRSGALAALEKQAEEGRGRFRVSLKWAGRPYSNWPRTPADIQDVVED